MDSVLKTPPRRGVALVVTLLMLSVITVVAVAFLSLSRRGRGNVTQTLNLTDARQATDTALERAIGQTIAPILATTNMLYGDLVVSRNFINTNGFQPGVSDFRNVSYAYADGLPLSQADFLQNLTNMIYDPRPPVFVRTNRFGRTAPGAETEFRFYLDLNRNGQFETNGFFLPYNISLGRSYGTNVLFWVGDPEWIGVLEKPNQPHSANNRFIGRYAYIIIPVGKSLDANFVHNQSQQAVPALNRGRFLRNQGFGTYEINLAAFLTALNTNLVFGWGDYYYQGTNGGSTGWAFLNALDFVKYRYQGNYTNIDQVGAIFGANAPFFTSDKIDGLAWTPPVPPTASDPDRGTGFWPGSSSRRHFYSIHDYFDHTKMPSYPQGQGLNFVDRLNLLSSRFSSYDRYTFYRLVSQLGTDTAEEPLHADIAALAQQISATNSEQFLADTVGRININYDNINYVASDFTNWHPLTFFTNLANITLREQFPFGVTNIPVTPTNQYLASIQRLLQVSANIYDATTTDSFPSVFLPLVGLVPHYTNPAVKIPGIYGYALCTNRDTALQWVNQNTNGLPAIVGAKRGLPNFNEFVFQTCFQTTRKLEVGRPTTNSLPNQTNQILLLSISNLFGVENWNSYSTPFTNNVQVFVSNYLSYVLIDAANSNGFPPLASNVVAVRDFPIIASTNTNWHFRPRYAQNENYFGGFMLPLLTNVSMLTNSRYTGAGFDELTNSFIPRTGKLPAADWKLIVTNRLTYILSALPASATAPDVARGRVLDIVSLSFQTNLNLSALLMGPNTTFTEPSALARLWNTNRINYPATGSTPTEGIMQQLGVSLGNPALSDADWKDYNVNITPDKANSIANFKGFIYNTNYASSNLFQQAPFTASRRFVHTVTWQANDPLVHYMAQDLGGTTNQLRFLKPTETFTNNYNLGKLNQRYQPWLGNPQKDTADAPNPNDIYFGIKDPGVFGSDDWNFPSQKFPSIGWLGRIHRGTPWQTIYLKAEVAPPARWLAQSPELATHPTNDWRLLDIFTVAQTPNSSHGQLSVNQSGVAAWTAVLGGITVLSNTVVTTYQRQAPTNVVKYTIDPIVNAPVIQDLVDAINRARLQRPNQVFHSLGDLMSVPELTTQSPFINTVGDSSTPPDIIQTYGFNDDVYESIPQKILSLLKIGDARFVIYAFGQSLKPADKSIVTSGTYFGLCTNYQITGEVSTRTLVKIDRDLTTTNFVLNPKILNHNILPTE